MKISTKMHFRYKALLLAGAATILMSLPASLSAQDKETVLKKLDAAAANFRSTSADFQFDSYQTDPVPDKTTQKGTVYYERSGKNFQMAAHIAEENGKPVPKVYKYAKGEFQLYEKIPDQVTTYKNDKVGGYLLLGFGASGKQLEDKWDITYAGQEKLENITTDKLELVAKDPEVRKNLTKVTVWMDTSRGVSLKQLFDEGQGQSRVCVYFNFKLNQPLPSDAFTFKTDSKTQFVKR